MLNRKENKPAAATRPVVARMRERQPRSRTGTAVASSFRPRLPVSVPNRTREPNPATALRLLPRRKPKGRRRAALKLTSETVAAALDFQAETIKTLVRVAREHGHVTYDDINEVLPDGLWLEDLDDLYTRLRNLDVEIVDHAEVGTGQTARAG